MLDPELIERIRAIFLHSLPFVSIDDAAALLGWSRGEMRRAVAGHEVELSSTSSGRAITRDEVAALALTIWPIEWIEEGLDTRAADILPASIRSRNVSLRLPGYQAAMLDYLAERDRTTTSHLVSRALDDLAAERFEVLAPAIPGFTEAVAWPDVDQTLQPC